MIDRVPDIDSSSGEGLKPNGIKGQVETNDWWYWKVLRIDKDNWDWDALLRIHIVCISDQFQWSPFQLSSQEGCSYSERVISSFLQREDDFLLPKQEILRLSPSKMSQFYWFQILRLSLDVAPGSTVALVSHTFLLSPSFPVSIVSWHLCARWDLKTQILTIGGISAGWALGLWQVHLYPARPETLRSGGWHGLYF